MVSIQEENIETNRRRPREDKDRDWSLAARATRGRTGKEVSSRAFGSNVTLHQHLDFELLASRTMRE